MCNIIETHPKTESSQVRIPQRSKHPGSAAVQWFWVELFHQFHWPFSSGWRLAIKPKFVSFWEFFPNENPFLGWRLAIRSSIYAEVSKDGGWFPQWLFVAWSTKLGHHILRHVEKKSCAHSYSFCTIFVQLIKLGSNDAPTLGGIWGHFSFAEKVFHLIFGKKTGDVFKV